MRRLFPLSCRRCPCSSDGAQMDPRARLVVVRLLHTSLKYSQSRGFVTNRDTTRTPTGAGPTPTPPVDSKLSETSRGTSTAWRPLASRTAGHGPGPEGGGGGSASPSTDPKYPQNSSYPMVPERSVSMRSIRPLSSSTGRCAIPSHVRLRYRSIAVRAPLRDTSNRWKASMAPSPLARSSVRTRACTARRFSIGSPSRVANRCAKSVVSGSVTGLRRQAFT
mmetsp:Transcript_57830/g.103242  ORF Transcript_57830/g.103242 Transcript_57830/m.103242 type:complete len:221 (-) Transcript_57830:183-845(-)